MATRVDWSSVDMIISLVLNITINTGAAIFYYVSCFKIVVVVTVGHFLL